MTTFQTVGLSKPTGANKIPTSVLVYMRTRLRQRFHSAILKAFVESGLSQADLARRLGRSPRVVHRWLSSPENMRISTLSDLIFAINGGEPSEQIEQPLEAAPSNRTMPAWLANAIDEQKFDINPQSKTGSSSNQRAYVQFNKTEAAL